MNSEEESTRDWRAERDWQRPTQAEVEVEAVPEPEFVDGAISELPAEVDLAAQTRWMRAVPDAKCTTSEFRASFAARL